MQAHSNRATWFTAGKTACDVLAPAREHPWRLVLLGPPGVGKGTQAELLCKTLHTCHLSTGDLFRAAQCQCDVSPAMQAAIDAVKRGELVAEEVVINMVRERSLCLQCCGGILLDGFPRSVRQAQALDEMMGQLGITLDAVLCYDLSLDECVTRISGRRTCKGCKKTFHVANHPPQVEGICDHCSGELFQRADDQPEAIRTRLQVYEAETAPVIDYYQRTGRLIKVPAAGSPEVILQKSIQALNAHVGKDWAVP